MEEQSQKRQVSAFVMNRVRISRANRQKEREEMDSSMSSLGSVSQHSWIPPSYQRRSSTGNELKRFSSYHDRRQSGSHRRIDWTGTISACKDHPDDESDQDSVDEQPVRAYRPLRLPRRGSVSKQLSPTKSIDIITIEKPLKGSESNDESFNTVATVSEHSDSFTDSSFDRSPINFKEYIRKIDGGDEEEITTTDDSSSEQSNEVLHQKLDTPVEEKSTTVLSLFDKDLGDKVEENDIVVKAASSAMLTEEDEEVIEMELPSDDDEDLYDEETVDDDDDLFDEETLDDEDSFFGDSYVEEEIIEEDEEFVEEGEEELIEAEKDASDSNVEGGYAFSSILDTLPKMEYAITDDDLSTEDEELILDDEILEDVITEEEEEEENDVWEEMEELVEEIEDESDEEEYIEESVDDESFFEEETIDDGLSMVEEYTDDEDDLQEENDVEVKRVPAKSFEVPFIPVLKAWEAKQDPESEEIAREIEETGIVPATPRDILNTIIESGALEFKLRKVPKEHRRTFQNVASEAVSLARLTRLKEHVIESESCGASKQKENSWTPTGKPIELQRTTGVRLANEAAAIGKLRRLRAKEYSHYQGDEKMEEKEIISVDKHLDRQTGPRGSRIDLLLHKHERAYNKDVKGIDWELNILRDISDQEDQRRQVQLPSSKVPGMKLRRKQEQLSSEEISIRLAQGVAEGAWNRKYRLERRRVELKITKRCLCKYCKTANPFQTHAYKKAEADIKKGLPPPPSPKRKVKKRVSLDLTNPFF